MATRFLRQRRSAEKKVAAFNHRFRVGNEVIYMAYPGADPVRDRIFAEAEVLSGHTAVVWLAGQRSCVDVDHITPAQQLEAPDAP